MLKQAMLVASIRLAILIDFALSKMRDLWGANALDLICIWILLKFYFFGFYFFWDFAINFCFMQDFNIFS